MMNQRPHPPLTVVEKTLIETYCIARPCEALRALFKDARPNRDCNRDAIYAGCRTICRYVHYCPLEGGSRYVGFARSCHLPAKRRGL
jgi:hypothetical protein